MTMGSIQPLTELSTKIISLGKGGRCLRQKIYHHPVPLSYNLGTLTSWNPLGLSRPVMGLLYLDDRSWCILLILHWHTVLIVRPVPPVTVHTDRDSTNYITADSF